jgi:hypothetical protein
VAFNAGNIDFGLTLNAREFFRTLARAGTELSRFSRSQASAFRIGDSERAKEIKRELQTIREMTAEYEKQKFSIREQKLELVAELKLQQQKFATLRSINRSEALAAKEAINSAREELDVEQRLVEAQRQRIQLVRDEAKVRLEALVPAKNQAEDQLRAARTQQDAQQREVTRLRQEIAAELRPRQRERAEIRGRLRLGTSTNVDFDRDRLDVLQTEIENTRAQGQLGLSSPEARLRYLKSQTATRQGSLNTISEEIRSITQGADSTILTLTEQLRTIEGRRASADQRLTGLRQDEARRVNRTGVEAEAARAEIEAIQRKLTALSLDERSLQLEKQKVQAAKARAIELLKEQDNQRKLLETEQRRLKINEAIYDAITVAVGAFATSRLQNFAKESALLAARVENLGTILENVGQVAGYSRGELAFLERKVKDLGITTQAARQSLSVLALNEQDLGQAAQLARIAQDAAAISSRNSSQAFEDLTVAIQRLDTRMLRNLGIVVNLRQLYARYALETGKTAENLSAQEKQQLLLNEVLQRGASIAGTYEASMNDAFKQLTSLDRLTEEASRTFGEQFVPVLELVATLVTDVAGRDDKSGFRGASNTIKIGLASLTSFAVVAGSIVLSLRAVTAAVGLFGGSLSLLNPITLGIAVALGLVAAGYVAVTARARAAEKALEAHNLKIEEAAFKYVALRDSLETISELGAFSQRSAAQQLELANAMSTVIALMPLQAAQLKQLKNDYQAFVAVAKNAFPLARESGNQRIGRLDREADRIAAQIDSAALFGSLGARNRASVSRDFFSRSVRRQNLEEQSIRTGSAAFRELFGVSGDEFAAEGREDRINRVEQFAQTIRNLPEIPPQLISDLELVFGPDRVAEVVQLARALGDYRIEIRELEEALANLRRQELDTIFDKQQDAADNALRILRANQKDLTKAVEGTLAQVTNETIDAIDQLSTRFLTLEEAAERRQANIAAAEERIKKNFEEQIAAAQELADREQDRTKLTELQARQAEAIADATAVANQEEIQAIEQLERRNKALEASYEIINRRIEETRKTNEELAREVEEAALGVPSDISKLRSELLELQEKSRDVETSFTQRIREQEAALKLAYTQRDAEQINRFNRTLEQVRDAYEVQSREFVLNEQRINNELGRVLKERVDDLTQSLRSLHSARDQLRFEDFVPDNTLQELEALAKGFDTARESVNEFIDAQQRLIHQKEGLSDETFEVADAVRDYVENIDKATSTQQVDTLLNTFKRRFALDAEAERRSREALQKQLEELRNQALYGNIEGSEFNEQRDALERQIAESLLREKELERGTNEALARLNDAADVAYRRLDPDANGLTSEENARRRLADLQAEELKRVNEKLAKEERVLAILTDQLNTLNAQNQARGLPTVTPPTLSSAPTATETNGVAATTYGAGPVSQADAQLTNAERERLRVSGEEAAQRSSTPVSGTTADSGLRGSFANPRGNVGARIGGMLVAVPAGSNASAEDALARILGVQTLSGGGAFGSTLGRQGASAGLGILPENLPNTSLSDQDAMLRALEENGASTVSGLETARNVFREATQSILATKQRVDSIVADIEREADGWQQAFQRNGLRA